DEQGDDGLRQPHRPAGDGAGQAHGLGAGGVLFLESALLIADTRPMKSRNRADATKARWMSVYHISLSLAYFSTLRNTCSTWIEEIVTMVDATLILSELMSISPSQCTSSSLSNLPTKFS